MKLSGRSFFNDAVAILRHAMDIQPSSDLIALTLGAEHYKQYDFVNSQNQS